MRGVLIFIFLSASLQSFCLSNSFYSVADNKVDSLKTLLATAMPNDARNDVLTINRINTLAATYIDINPDSTLYYGQKAINLSRKINYTAGIANALLQISSAEYFKGQFAEAKQNLDKAIALYTQLKDKKGIGECYVVYGCMYRMQSDYPLALKYLKQALPILIQQKDDKSIANCYKNMGMVYFGKGQHSLALDYYYKALFIGIKEHNKYATADIYNNIGDVLQNMEVYPKALEYYYKALQVAHDSNNLLGIGTSEENIGEVLFAQKQYNEAIVHLSKSIDIAIKQDDKDGISYISADLGLCYAHKNQTELALKYLNTALRTAIQYNNAYDKAYALVGLATTYNLQKDYNKAYNYAVQGESLALKLNNLWFKANAVFELHKALAGLGKFEDAYALSMQYIHLKDSLNNNESIQKITSYNLEYNFTAKQRKIEQQQHEKDELYNQKIKQQRLNLFFMGVILLAAIIISVVYYKGKRKQQHINAILEEKNMEVLAQKAGLDEQADQLNDLNHLKDRLISILAHDLRAPLSTLRGLFSLLEDDNITHEQFLEMIPQALKKLEYTSDFLDTLLFWINSQMDNFGNSAKNFSVKEIISYEVDNYQEQAALKGIILNDYVENNIIALADPSSIRIVIRNLITNAIKFTGKNDIITVNAYKQDDNTILISIKDSGKGMPEQQLVKLFKSKVDSGVGTNNETGTGMGLLFCKDLIEKSKGSIWVESTLGEGTEFFFTIPLGEFQADVELVS